jgi:beta-lactamase regulating signal transducer with metallopeptidase domain
LPREKSPGPLLLGFVRPIVLLPASLGATGGATGGGAARAAATRRALTLALLHELAHARRRDPLANLVTLLVQVAFWFHPLAWWARRRLLALAELSVDRDVVRALGGESLAYRRTLARLAPSPGEWLARPGLAFGGATSQIVTRLEALRSPARPDGTLARAAALAVPGAALVLGALAPPVSTSSLEQARAVAAVAPDDLRGCLELRHAVLARIALGADERR